MRFASPRILLTSVCGWEGGGGDDANIILWSEHRQETHRSSQGQKKISLSSKKTMPDLYLARYPLWTDGVLLKAAQLVVFPLSVL